MSEEVSLWLGQQGWSDGPQIKQYRHVRELEEADWVLEGNMDPWTSRVQAFAFRVRSKLVSVILSTPSEGI